MDTNLERPTRPVAARWATNDLFFVCGVGYGVWATQIPRFKANLELSDGSLSLALLSFALGAILMMPLTGWATARIGSRPASIAGGLTFALGLALIGFAPDLPWLIALALIAGGASGALDVSMNTHATATEREWGSAIMSSFHGFFSLGGLVGAVTGGFLIKAGLSVSSTLLVTGVAAALLVLAAGPFVRLKSESLEGGHAFAWPTRAVLGIGILTFLCMIIEGAVADWSAVYLREWTGAAPEVAGSGYAAFSLAMMVCRFAGDRIVRRFGRVRVVGIGGALAGIGLVMAIGTSSPLLTALGFGLVGLGLANTVPVLFSAAGETGGTTPGVGVAMAASLGYAGFLLGPPAIGITADAVGLRGALTMLVAGALCIALFARAAAPAAQGSPSAPRPSSVPRVLPPPAAP
jgi:MFS family permease